MSVIKRPARAAAWYGSRPKRAKISCIRATVAGGVFNNATAYAAAIGGGDGNVAAGDRSAVLGGYANQALGSVSAVGGGILNMIQAGSASSTIAGGTNNLIQAGLVSSTIAGGSQNSIFVGGTPGNPLTKSATIGGGQANTIYGTVDAELFNNPIYATISGGYGNTVYGNSATIPGGYSNTAYGDFSFAAGAGAAAGPGSFVWADPTGGTFGNTAANQFCIRAGGGVLLSDSTPNLSFGSATRQMVNLWGTQYGIGVQNSTLYFRTDNAAGVANGFAWYKGGTHNNTAGNAGGGSIMMRLDGTGLIVNGTFVSGSDRNIKQDFGEVNARAILEKVAQLPIQTWAYKNDPGTKHLGPMAQDFFGAFAIGPDDKHITTVDEGGVALAAIQGLHELVKEKDAKILALEGRLTNLEKLVTNLAQKQSKVSQ